MQNFIKKVQSKSSLKVLWAVSIASITVGVITTGPIRFFFGQLFWNSIPIAAFEFIMLIAAHVLLTTILIPATANVDLDHSNHLLFTWACTGEKMSSTTAWPGLLGLIQIACVEEAIARGLFAGAIPGVFHGYLIFWALLGNMIWALLHLANPGIGKPHPLKVLPQFAGGFIYLVGFLLFGLFGAIALHLTHDLLMYILPFLPEIIYKIKNTRLYNLVLSKFSQVTSAKRASF